MPSHCKALATDKNTDDSIDFELLDSISGIPKDLVPNPDSKNIFFSPQFLKTASDFSPKNMTSVFIKVLEHGEVIGFLPCQIGNFRADESINFKKFNPIAARIVKRIHFETFVCGNVLLTGENISYFVDDISKEKRDSIVFDAINFAVKELNRANHNIRLIFVKEFFPANKFTEKQRKSNKYFEFKAYPNMILNIRENWLSYDDYLSNMSSKYRMRMKKARKKLGGIVKLELNEEQVLDLKDDIYGAYLKIVQNAPFNLFVLDEDYIPELKKQLKDQFKVWGYFKEDKLIAFHTSFMYEDYLKASFIGFHPDESKEHDLYLNMLLDFAEIGIKNNLKQVIFARTATEIKSSVGAEIYPMHCYLKHKNFILNSVISFIFRFLNDNSEVKTRSPFKD